MTELGRVLLVSHEASRSGAPRVAVEIARALREGGFHVTTLMRWGGPLERDLLTASSRTRLELFRHARAFARRWRRLQFVADRADETVAGVNLRLLARPDVVYVNTTKSAAYVGPALGAGIPTVLHVHETGALLVNTLRRYRFDPSDALLHLVACSAPIADELAAALGVSRHAVQVVESHTDSAEVVAAAGRTSRHRGSVPVVGACAVADERKGVDLWLDAVDRIRRDGTAARFVWVGRTTSCALDAARRRDLQNVVEFVGDVTNPYPLMNAMDIFCLPSRADPFPLAVLEAMALEKPVVAFDVGGVARQLGDAGLLVPAGDVGSFADAIRLLLRDESRRRELGEAAGERVRRLFDRNSFATAVRELVQDVVDRDAADGPVVVARDAIRIPSRRRDCSPVSVELLQAFDPSALDALRTGVTTILPYRIEAMAEAGCDLTLTDAMYRGIWRRPVVRWAVTACERATAPFLQSLLASRRIARSDAVVTMFESQANSLAALRSLGVPSLRRPRLVVISCWLARDLERFGVVRRVLYRFAYRSVDRLVFFSASQALVFQCRLGLPRERLVSVPFGVDHDYFRPEGVLAGDAVVSVGRDLGRDWATLFGAVRGSSFSVKVACRPETIRGLDVPENVMLLGTIRRDQYRELLATAQVVVIAVHDVQYPSGQSVLLEAMAMGKCCVVTMTAALSEYVVDGETAIAVPTGEPEALRAAIERVRGDAALRERIGKQARAAIDSTFNAPAMWRAIADVVIDAVRSQGTSGS